MTNEINALLIINPKAGRTRLRPAAYDIVRLFPDNYKFTIDFTRCSGDATRIVKERFSGHDIIICAGGDGTLNEVINGIMALPQKPPVGYIPIGSTNDFASTLGIPSKLKDAVQVIVDGHVNDYDIGLFNGRFFTYTAAFGALTQSSYTTSQTLKNSFGHLAYVVDGVVNLRKVDKSIPAKVECDQGEFEGKFVFGTITNSTSVAGVFKLDENEVRLNDGKFEFLLVNEMKSLAQAPSYFGQMRKRHYDGKRISLFHTGKVKITFEKDIAWTVDGEFGGNHRVIEAENIKKALKIFSPEEKLFSED